MNRKRVELRLFLLGRFVAVGTALLLATAGVAPAGTAEFVRGDVDDSGDEELTDAVQIFSYLFLGTGVLSCEDAGDVDDNGTVELTDGVYLLNYLFLGGPPPPPPFPGCGADETEDPLGCTAFVACAEAGPLQLDLESSGGFTGRGSRDVHLQDGVLAVHTPFDTPEDCTAQLRPEQLERLLSAIAAVDWAALRSTYRSPENPGCCCDQFIYEFSISSVATDGTPVSARTDWCDEALIDGRLPPDFLSFLESLHAIADEAVASCGLAR